MEMRKEQCPWCGGEDLTRDKQAGYGQVFPEKSILRLDGKTLIHVICRRCGTVVRSYVEDPDTLK